MARGDALSFTIEATAKDLSDLKRFADQVEKVGDAVQDLGKQKASPKIDVDTKKADSQLDKFAAGLKKKVSAAIKALPELEITADSSDADKELSRVRRELVELGDKEIGVDIDAATAEAKLRELRATLTRINAQSVDLKVKADTTDAVRALGSIKKLDAFEIKVDSGRADAQIGAFATSLNRKITDAIRSLPEIEITADSSDADLELAAIRADLAELSDQRIGIDVDATLAQARVDDLARRLHELSGTTGNIQVDADTAAAAAKLGFVEEQLNRIDGDTANARVDIDTSAALTAITTLGRVMGGLALGGGILAAGPQLASLAASAIAAAGALGAIPAAIGAGGAAFGAIKIGLTGLSDAFDALGKADATSAATASSGASQREAAAQRIASAQQSLADAQEQAARSAIQSAQAVAAAQQGVADAIENANERAADSARQVAQAQAAVADAVDSAARRVESAEASVERAQVSARDAQEALNRARVDAKEKIEDMALALSGAALDEESAQIRLGRAQERLAKLSRTGGSALDFQEANLGVRQAQQGLLEVRERYADIKQEAQDTNAKGVEGADNVVAAQRRVTDANRSVADAEKNLQQTRLDGQKSIAAAQDRLTQAQEQQRRSAEDSARSIARAEDNLAKARQQQAWAQQDSAKAVSRAQQQVAQAMKAASDSAAAGAPKIDKYAESLAKLSPNARAFVEQIKALKPRWDELTKAVQNNLFAGVAEQTKSLADLYLPKLQGLFSGIAASANRSAIDVAKFFQQGDTSAAMQVAFDRIGKAIDTAAQAALPLVKVFTTVFTIGTEFLQPMADGFKNLADRMAAFTATAEGQNKIRAWIQGGIDTIKQFGQLLWNIGGIFKTVFDAGNTGGVNFLGTLVELTGHLKEFLRSAEGQATLKAFFDGLRDTIDKLKPGLSAIWDALTGAIREIAPKMPGVAESFSRLAEKLAPILKDIAVALFDAFAFAFDVLSRVPAPVLVGAAALFVALAGAIKAAAFLKELKETFTVLKGIKDFPGVGRALDGIGAAAKTAATKVGALITKLGAVKVPAALRGAGLVAGTAAGLGALAVAADNVLPEADPARAGNSPLASATDYTNQQRQDLSDIADAVRGIFNDPLAELGKQWDDFWSELGGFPAAFDQSPFMQFWRGIPNWWRDEVWGPLKIDASAKWGEFTGWWDGVTIDFSTTWTGFWDGLGTNATGLWTSLTTGASEGWTGFTTWMSEQWTTFQTNWDAFWGGLGTTLSGLWDTVTQTVSEKWTGFTTWMSDQWTTFTTNWNAFWDGIGQWAATTWENIRVWASEKWIALTTWLSEQWATFTTNWNAFWDGAGAKVVEIWDNVKLWISTKWTEMTTWLSQKWSEFTIGWNGMWDTVGRYFSDRWEDIKRVASGAWTWIRDTVWQPLADFVTVTIPRAFDRAVEAIRIAWDKIKEIAAVPVRFVVNSVYNGGIVPAWNKLAGLVGLGALAPVPVQFATGGVVPGYAPGRDTVPAMLSPGEGILRPEATRAFGSRWIAQVNTLARNGGEKAVAQFMNTGGESATQFFAGGGVVAGQNFARAQQGKPYQWGGVGPSGYDCCIIGPVRVYGPNGATPIKDVRAGDEVFSYVDGKLVVQTVTAAWQSKTQEVFKVRTRNRAVTASANHPFMRVVQVEPSRHIKGGARGEQVPARYDIEWARLDELKRGDLLVQPRAMGIEADPDPVLADGTPVDAEVAWLIGASVGDGTVTDKGLRLCLFGEKRDRATRIIENRWSSKAGHYASAGLVVSNMALARALAELGMRRLGPDKRVPDAVWTWPAEQRQAFLDGYCDADGHRPADPKRHGDRTYHGASRELIEDVRALHIMLGHPVSNVTTTKRTKPIVIKGKTVKNALPLHNFTVWPGVGRGETVLRSRSAGLAAWLDAGDFTLAPVLAISDEGIQDTYDLEVAGAHNFIADGVVVHNSGFQSAIANVVLGLPAHSRRFATGSFGANRGAGGFVPGTGSSYVIGISPNTGNGVGHAAGTLGGMNVESRGGDGVVVGPRARSATDRLFPWQFFLPQAGGNFVVSGSAQAVPAFDPVGFVKAAWGKVTSALSGADKYGNTEWGRGTVKTGQKMASSAYDKLVSAATTWGGPAGAAAGGIGGTTLSGGATAGGGVQGIVQSVANKFGWGGGAQWSALASIISRESGWNPNAQNPRSTAYGLGQFLNSTWATVGGSKTSNPALQAEYLMRYIRNRYQSPVGAASFWNSHHWYDSGGMIGPGATMAMNGTGRPERVLNPTNTASFDRLVASLDNGGRVRGGTTSLLDLAPVVGQLRALRGDVDHHGDNATIAAKLDLLNANLARLSAGGGTAAATAQMARSAAELGAF